ncbi:MAG TPA: ribosome maturation factor RimP [Thermoanaerobaculia bacterium]|jgi:ribosome maturation factor RimP
MKKPLSDKTTREIEAIAEEKGCRLLAVETAGAGRFTILRLVLERAGGNPVTVEDCELVSRDASAVLDASDEIAHRYTLEVSSAGLDRKLYSLEDAQRFVGHRVRVKTESPVTPDVLPAESATGRKSPAISPARNFGGVLSQVDGDRLTVVDEAERRIYNVRFGDIRLARLDFEWPRREGQGR